MLALGALLMGVSGASWAPPSLLDGVIDDLSSARLCYLGKLSRTPRSSYHWDRITKWKRSRTVQVSSLSAPLPILRS